MVFQTPWWSCCFLPPGEGGSSLPSRHIMILLFPCGTGDLPTTMQDRRQPLHPVGWSSCSCRCRGIRQISNNQEQWAGLAVAHSSFGSGIWRAPGISDLSRLHTLHTAETALLPAPPAHSSLGLPNCTSLKVTSWSTSTKSRRPGDRKQGGSARSTWLCLQTILPSWEESSPGTSMWRLKKPYSAAGHSPPL